MSTLIYNFQKDSRNSDWQIVNDGVMGGMSQGQFTIDQDGHGKFFGSVSTENNGGFSSLKHAFSAIKIEEKSSIRLRVKGDGKNYQFRIKDKLSTSHSYISSFSTNGEWQEIEISLKDFYPSYRGTRLTIPNFDKTSFEEVRFLIGNKANENFSLLLDKIEVV